MANRGWAALALAVAAGGGAVALLAPVPAPRPALEAGEVSADLDGAVRGAAEGLHQRADMLAAQPILASAVSTDALTVRNLTQEELAFRPLRGETITIGQVLARDKTVQVLLVLPSGGTAPRALDRDGARLEIIDGKLCVVEVMPVKPGERSRAAELTGVLAVSWPIDLGAIAKRLDGAGATLRLEVAGQTLAVGARPVAANDVAMPVVLRSEIAGPVHAAVLRPPAPAPLPLKPIGLGAALVGLLAGAWLLRPGRRSPAVVAPAGADIDAAASPGVITPLGASTYNTPITGAGVGGTAAGLGLGHAPAGATNLAAGATNLAVGATNPAGAPGLGAGTGIMSNAGAGDIRVGSVIQGTYEVTRLLGRGGMGAVWEARHLRLPDKKVAIKLLLGEQINDELLARFRREAEVTSKLGHPNIVGVLDFNTLPSGAPYLVLEFLEGESLATRLERGPLPLGQALDLARQIGSALHAAHRANVVHRDLKPDNIFLVPLPVESGEARVQVKVLDFGISKIRGAITVQTREAAVFGTPQYMSPEQANGKNSQVDARSDIWALGAIVFEMISGRRAFDGDAITSVIVQVVFTPSPSLSELPSIPPQVIAAVDRALAKDPAARFADMPSFIEALTGSRL